MKIRNGFVSNSSSSSFLIGIDPECKTFNDFVQIGLYESVIVDGDFKSLEEIIDTYVPDCDCYNNDKWVTYRDCFKNLWDDIMVSPERKANIKVCKNFMKYDSITTNIGYEREFYFISWCDTHNICNSYDGDERKKCEEKFDKIREEWNKIVGDALIKRLMDQFDHNIYVITYSDNDGESLMEHGDFWQLIPHVRIDQH